MGVPLTYKEAGVDIDAGREFVAAIEPMVESTRRPEVIGGLGGFASLCRIPARYREPLLVCATDGVGSKLEIAFQTGRHENVGVDLVAMAVNDVITCAAEPLLFLDYLAVGRLEVALARALVAGMVEGCKQAGCALVGGETAEMPGFYPGSRYDLAGFCLGVVERDQVADGRDIRAGDSVIGLASSGLHANGHSLARQVLLSRFALDDTPDELAGASVADELTRPAIIYARALAEVRDRGPGFKAAAHITGGGLIDNPPRMLRDPGLAIELHADAWRVPPVFNLIASAGVAEHEMRRTFNMGVGMMLVVENQAVPPALAALARVDADSAPEHRLDACVIGRVVARTGGPEVRS